MAESKLRTLSVDFAVQILNLVKFRELFGVSARKVSEWEHRKSLNCLIEKIGNRKQRLSA